MDRDDFRSLLRLISRRGGQVQPLHPAEPKVVDSIADVPPPPASLGYTAAEITRLAHDFETLRNAARELIDVYMVPNQDAEEVGYAISQLASELYRQEAKPAKGVTL